MKFCVNFVLKYAYVNYDNSKEKDLIWSCQLFLSLVTLKIGAIIYLQIYLFIFFLKMSSGIILLVSSQIYQGTFLRRRR